MKDFSGAAMPTDISAVRPTASRARATLSRGSSKLQLPNEVATCAMFQIRSVETLPVRATENDASSKAKEAASCVVQASAAVCCTLPGVFCSQHTGAKDVQKTVHIHLHIRVKLAHRMMQPGRELIGTPCVVAATRARAI